MELFLHNKISEEQTLWWNLYSVTTCQVQISYFCQWPNARETLCLS